jgi:hypothetical protein
MKKLQLALACCLLLPVAVRAAGPGGAATVRTANFSVEAVTPQIAARVARAAERLRKEKAVEWLGRELPQWSTPCPVRVGLSFDGHSHTDFALDNSLKCIVLEGSIERVLDDTLPHEMTHAILNPNVGFDLPCWADEGAAVLSSSEHDRDRFDDLMHRYYCSDHFVPLERLFPSRTYLPDWVMLYAEGYSITSFLVKARDRKTFLAFVASGQRDGWDQAVKQYYGYSTVATLERAWLQSLSWTGKRIVARKAGVKISYTDARSGQVIDLANLDRGIYTVLKEKGDWIKVRHRNVTGWLAKDDAVLLDNAVGHFTQRIRLLPQDSHAFSYRGLAWLEKGDAARAITDLNVAIELAPDHATWYVLRGKAHIRNDDYRRAIADFAEAVSRVARPNTQ